MHPKNLRIEGGSFGLIETVLKWYKAQQKLLYKVN